MEDEAGRPDVRLFGRQPADQRQPVEVQGSVVVPVERDVVAQAHGLGEVRPIDLVREGPEAGPHVGGKRQRRGLEVVLAQSHAGRHHVIGLVVLEAHARGGIHEQEEADGGPAQEEEQVTDA